MGWLGIGLKLGVGVVGSGHFTLDNPSTQIAGQTLYSGIAGTTCLQGIGVPSTCRVATHSRTGFQLSLPINLGGDGASWDIEPYLNFANNGTAVGFYTGPMFNIHVIDPLYIGFGFGIKLAVVQPKGYDIAVDAYGRIPLRVTYYVLDKLGLVGEFGFGYGASAYASLAKTTVVNGVAVKQDATTNFGPAPTWDLSVGVRFP
jgi:hypothetical protein